MKEAANMFLLHRLKLLGMHTWWLQVRVFSLISPDCPPTMIVIDCQPTMMSGIPVRNGVAHAREIARMSLKLMETVKVMRMMVMVMVMVMVNMNLYLCLI